MLHRGHIIGVFQVAFCWDDCGNIRFPELVWVRHAFMSCWNQADLCYSDFFPVILTFLRQLPFIGHFLTLPYVRDVSYSYASYFAAF
jgi:hypothetical protein